MTVSLNEIHAKAAANAAQAVIALANRAEEKGHAEFDPAKKPKAGWVVADRCGIEALIHPEKLREAIAYYEIASSLNPVSAGTADFALYSKARLLEELGDYAEAEQAYRASAYDDGMLAVHVNRCRAKQQGTFNAEAYFMDAMRAQMGQYGMGSTWIGKMFHVVEEDPPAATRECSEQAEEQASAVALKFVNLLLDKDYATAKTMLHSTLADGTESNLREPFEALFEGDENFPEIASVYGVWSDTPDMLDEDLACVYVTIDDSENAEAVSVRVTRENGSLTIREIEWGRP